MQQNANNLFISSALSQQRASDFYFIFCKYIA